MARLLAPFRDRASYRRLAFLASALPLAAVWFAVLMGSWTLVLSVAITPLVIPALIAIGFVLQGSAAVEAALSHNLLDARRRVWPRREGQGILAQAWAVLADGSLWRAQAYLLVRMTLGFVLAVVLLAALASAASMVLAPILHFVFPGGVRIWARHQLDSFAESLALLPAGLLLLLAIAHGLAPLGTGWRTLSDALLATDTQQAGVSGSRERPPRRRAGVWHGAGVHAASVAGVSLTLIIIWALTSRAYFWPVWPMLVAGTALAIHAWVVWVGEHPAVLLRLRLTQGFAIHAGVWAALLLFLTAVWAITARGYFWPVWPMLAALLALVPHAATVLLRPPDRTALTERISALETSRAGAVDVQDAELRRIERDLHDGAQARLVALGMSIGMAEQKLATDAEAARQLLAEARAGAGEALRELRDLARGIHPPVLADRGLEAAVRALASGSPLSVEVSAELPERPQPPVESAAYFVVAEALANAGKHAGASRVDVRIRRHGPTLSVSIHDDGVGGANPSGPGLSGLRRRVEALDGSLEVFSPAGGPTTIRAELPCGS
jgi:signal transduction histidine kinase